MGDGWVDAGRTPPPVGCGTQDAAWEQTPTHLGRGLGQERLARRSYGNVGRPADPDVGGRRVGRLRPDDAKPRRRRGTTVRAHGARRPRSSSGRRAHADRCGVSLVGDRAESEARSAAVSPGRRDRTPRFLRPETLEKPDTALSMAGRGGGWKGLGGSHPQMLAPLQRHWRSLRSAPVNPPPATYRHHNPRVRTRRTQRSNSRRTRSVWRSANARRRQRR